MNPWDDDIDMTVLDCKLLDYLWETGEQNVTQSFYGQQGGTMGFSIDQS